jgi:Ni,Fe-hydrogenase III small subunit
MTVVSLGIKNLKGMIDIPSRKRCHNTHPQNDLHFWVARLADRMPPMLTLIDGIYTAERGPNIDGTMHRGNLLIASADVLSADLVGAKVLGHDPAAVPHLEHAAANRRRPVDLGDVEVVGESPASVARPHAFEFEYTADKTLPLPMAKMGIRGLAYPKFDLSLCTYCSGLTRSVLLAIARAWKGKPWDDIEVLSGKVMKPSPGRKKTILFGKCMVQANKDDPRIREMIAIKGCPPKPKAIMEALVKAGIDVDPAIFENIERLPGNFLKRYAGKPEFDEGFYTVAARAS